MMPTARTVRGGTVRRTSATATANARDPGEAAERDTDNARNAAEPAPVDTAAKTAAQDAIVLGFEAVPASGARKARRGVVRSAGRSGHSWARTAHREDGCPGNAECRPE